MQSKCSDAQLCKTSPNPIEINSNNAIETKTSKIRSNCVIFLGFLCSLGDYLVTPGTLAEGTLVNTNCSCTRKSTVGKQLWPWPPVLVTPAEPASKEPLVFISRCWKLGSCCCAHLVSILDLIHFTWALGQAHFGTRWVRRHCQQQLQQLRSQFCLSDVVFLFPHIISMAFQNSSPENATAYKWD